METRDINKEDLDTGVHFWHVLSEERLTKIALVLAESHPKGFSESQFQEAVNEMVASELGNVLLLLVTEGEFGVAVSEQDGKSRYFAKKPTSKLDLIPGQRLKYTEFGQQHLKKRPEDRVTFVRWIQEGEACILKVRDTQNEVSNKKYHRVYLDFLMPDYGPELVAEEDWSI